MQLRYRLLFSLCFGLTTGYAQEVRLLKLEALERRMGGGADTTYVVNLWATWCVPCVQELPYFEQLQEQYTDKPLKVLLVSLDFPSRLESQVIPFVQKHKLKSEVFVLDESDQQEYIDRLSKTWSGSIPATLIINPQKDIRSFFEQEFTYEGLEQALAQLGIL